MPDYSIKDMSKNKRCSQCGSCCAGLLPVTHAELKAMKDYADSIDFAPKLPPVKPGEDLIYLRCPFLQTNTAGACTCAIYPARPGICKAFTCWDTLRTVKDSLKYGVNGKDCVSTNIWSLYNQTGLALRGRYIQWNEADRVKIELEDGTELTYQQGQPVHPVMNDGTSYPTGIILALSETGVQFTNGPSGILFLNWNDIDTL